MKDIRAKIHTVLKTKQVPEGINKEINGHAFFFRFCPVISEKKLLGTLVIIEELNFPENIVEDFKSYKELNMDLKAIFDSSYDVIYVSDGNGKTLRVSSACERLWGKKESELVGKNVSEIEKMGIYKPSVTRLVLEEGKKVSRIQTTSTGRKLMVVGTPIKDENGNIVRVVNASRDITEVNKLQSEIEEMKQLINGYKQELMELRKKNYDNKNVIYQSKKMEAVFDLAQRIANVDSTVLILGES
ncbi:PAS domain S-box protein, partial [Butyricicoccus sp. 1XD8-22]